MCNVPLYRHVCARNPVAPSRIDPAATLPRSPLKTPPDIVSLPMYDQMATARCSATFLLPQSALRALPLMNSHHTAIPWETHAFISSCLALSEFTSLHPFFKRGDNHDVFLDCWIEDLDDLIQSEFLSRMLCGLCFEQWHFPTCFLFSDVLQFYTLCGSTARPIWARDMFLK